jgi:undecaprenyl-diphosphatase
MMDHASDGTHPDRDAGTRAVPTQRRALLAAAWAAIFLALLGFGWLAYGVAAGTPFDVDRPLLLALHARAQPGLDQLMLLASRVGSGRFMLPLDGAVLVLLLVVRRVRAAVFWVVATGGASLLDTAVKHVFERARPDLWVSIAPESTYSFPSGHAMQTLAPVVAGIVLTWPTRWRAPVAVVGVAFVLVVGVSRAYLGVHYPTDVLAGWLAAAAWVGCASMVLQPQRTRAAK